MNKTLFILTLFGAMFMPCASLHADDDAEPKRMTSADRKAALKNFVETRENGDIVVKQNPASDLGKKSEAPKVPAAVMELMLHIDPDLDFKKFNRIMSKHIQDDVHIRETMQGCGEYLAAYNIKVSRAKQINPSNIRSRINMGVPFFVALYNKDGWDQKITERTEKRANAKDMKEWQETLKKETLKGKRDSVVGPIKWCLAWGYNKDSNEFLVNMEGNEMWMTESELKLFHHSLYELR